jgi:hypothetical protein
MLMPSSAGVDRHRGLVVAEIAGARRGVGFDRRFAGLGVAQEAGLWRDVLLAVAHVGAAGGGATADVRELRRAREGRVRRAAADGAALADQRLREHSQRVGAAIIARVGAGRDEH